MNRGPAGFCRWCGTPLGRPTDPVLGVTTRRTFEGRGGSMIGTIIGVLALVAVVALTGWLFTSGTMQRLIPSSPPTAVPTVTVRPSVSPSPSGSVEPSPSPSESVEPSPSGSVDPSPSPSGSVEPSPTSSLPTDTNFSCEAGFIGDPDLGIWRVTSISWIPDRYDTLILELTLRNTDALEGAMVTVEAMPSGDVRERFGINGPANDRAIVLTFDGPVTIRADIQANPGLSAIEEVFVGEGTDGRVHAIIGTPGTGCFRLRAPEWDLGSPQDISTVQVDVRD